MKIFLLVALAGGLGFVVWNGMSKADATGPMPRPNGPFIDNPSAPVSSNPYAPINIRPGVTPGMYGPEPEPEPQFGIGTGNTAICRYWPNDLLCKFSKSENGYFQ